MAVYFLRHFPCGCPRRTLSGTVGFWSPDFPLSAKTAAIRPSDSANYLWGYGAKVKGCESQDFLPILRILPIGALRVFDLLIGGVDAGKAFAGGANTLQWQPIGLQAVRVMFAR